MGDNSNQKQATIVPCIQTRESKAVISTKTRAYTLRRIFKTLKEYYRPNMLSKVEIVARGFEGRIAASASDEKDYLRRISLKMIAFEKNARSASNSLIANHGPGHLHSASGNAQSQDIKHDQLLMQSKNPPQLQAEQIVRSINAPPNRGTCSTSSAVITAISNAVQDPRSDLTSTNSHLYNITRMPPNLETKVAEQHLSSSPQPVSGSQGQGQRSHMHQQLPRNHDRQFSEQEVQYQTADRKPSRKHVTFAVDADPRSLPQPQHQQIRPSRYPCTPKATSGTTTSRPAPMQFSSAYVPMDSQGSLATQSEKSVSHLRQPVSRQQYESWQHDIAHEKKCIATQRKSLPVHRTHERSGAHPSTVINQEKMLPQGRLFTPQELQQQAQSTAYNEEHQQQPAQHCAVPLVLISDSSVEQKPSKGFSSIQGEQVHAQVRTHPRPQVVKAENNPSSGVSSGSQSLTRPAVDTTQSGTLPLQASNNTDAYSAVQRQGVIEPWREEIYQRIIGMKKKYQSRVEEVGAKIDHNLKLLDMQPNVPNREQFVQGYKGAKNNAENILRFLNTPKQGIIPRFGERLDYMEQQIVFFLSKVFKSKKTVVQSSTPSVPLQTHSHDAHRQLEEMKNRKHPEQIRPPQLVQDQQKLIPLQQPASLQACTQHKFSESSSLEDKHLVHQHGEKCQYLPTAQVSHRAKKTISGTSSVPAPIGIVNNHQGHAQPSTSPLLLDCKAQTEICCSSTKITSNKSASQSPIKRLLNAVGEISSQSLKSSVDDINSVASMMDVMQGSAPGITFKAAVGEDLGRTTGSWMQNMDVTPHDDVTRTWTTRKRIRSIPFDMWNDQAKPAGYFAAENHSKRPKLELQQQLIEEINSVNQRLIDIVVGVSKEDMTAVLGEAGSSTGTVVECCFIGVSVNLSYIKSIAKSGHSSVVQPLRMLVPKNYPDSSPIILEKLPSENTSRYEDLSDKARSRLDIHLQGLNHPISLGDIAKTWERCVRAVIIELAEKFGGGTFSSIFGSWENCLGAAL